MAEQLPALRETPLQPSEFSSMRNHMGSAQYLQQVGKRHHPPQKIREAAGKNLCGQPALFLLGQLAVFGYLTSKRRVGGHFYRCSLEHSCVI